MKIEKTHIEDLLIIEPQVFGDERGFFLETYNNKRYKEAGIDHDFLQDNLSSSAKGVLRGLHFQKPPFAQGKLVQVIAGRVLDVAVDIRVGSPTYGEWVSIELSGENKKQFWIPPGFAHGFVTLEDNTLFSYKCTNVYAPEHDAGIIWSDRDLDIDWKMRENNIAQPIVSEKDQENLSLAELEPIFSL